MVYGIVDWTETLSKKATHRLQDTSTISFSLLNEIRLESTNGAEAHARIQRIALAECIFPMYAHTYMMYVLYIMVLREVVKITGPEVLDA